MFNLFNKNNPDKKYFNEINRLAEQSAKFMLFIKVKKCIPAQDGMDNLSLEIEENRLKTVNCFNTVVKDNELANVTNIDAVLVELIQEHLNKEYDQLYDDVLAFMSNADTINQVCSIYYEDFPKSDKLLEIVNHLAKIFSPAFIVIFGEDMPNSFRKIWPYLSNIFEHYKTKYYS